MTGWLSLLSKLVTGAKSTVDHRMPGLHRPMEKGNHSAPWPNYSMKGCKNERHIEVAMWTRAYPATDGHAYLLRKRVRAYGLKVAPTWEKRIRDEVRNWQTLLIKDVLLVPMRGWDGYLWNLQAIFPAKMETLGRDKDFLLGGRKQGLFHLIGTIDEAGTLVLVEGYATGCSVHTATGFPVLVCFDCGNLKAVAVEARRRFPTIDMVIAADNDAGTPGNPSLRHGREAALAARARMAFPTFDQQEVAA